MRACYSKTEEELKAVDFSDDATPVNEAMERDVVQHLISYVKERLNGCVPAAVVGTSCDQQHL